MMGHNARQFIHEIESGYYERDNMNTKDAMKAEFDAEVRRKQRGLLADQFNLDCGRVPLPTIDYSAARYEPKPDNGDRNRRTDKPAEKVSDPVNKPARQHSHYFKPVAHLTEIDVYRICDLYVDDRSGATQHAIKKLLLPGERGAGKTRAQDIQEAIDTLIRKLQMLQEDQAVI